MPSNRLICFTRVLLKRDLLAERPNLLMAMARSLPDEDVAKVKSWLSECLLQGEDDSRHPARNLLPNRFSGIDWSEQEDELIFYEYDRDKLWGKGWIYNIESKNQNLIHDISSNDKYNYPGDIVKKKSDKGEMLFIKKNDSSV